MNSLTIVMKVQMWNFCFSRYVWSTSSYDNHIENWMRLFNIVVHSHLLANMNSYKNSVFTHLVYRRTIVECKSKSKYGHNWLKVSPVPAMLMVKSRCIWSNIYGFVVQNYAFLNIEYISSDADKQRANIQNQEG